MRKMQFETGEIHKETLGLVRLAFRGGTCAAAQVRLAKRTVISDSAFLLSAIYFALG